MASLTQWRIEKARGRWRTWPRGVRLLVQLGLIVGIALVAFVLLQLRADVDSAAASVLVGIVLGAAAFLQNRQVERRQHTVELISALQNSETLSEADCWMADRISSGVPVTDEIEKDLDRLVITLLDYYEFLCILVERGYLDGGLLADLRGPAMARGFDICSAYVAVRREKVGSDLYRRFESFVLVYRSARERALNGTA